MGYSPPIESFELNGCIYFKSGKKFYKKTKFKKKKPISKVTFLRNIEKFKQFIENKKSQLQSEYKKIRYPAGKPIVLDLFSGAGGLSLGFEMAGFHVVGAIDFDKYCCNTYRYNFPTTAVIEDDITKIDPRNLPFEKERIDVVVGGPPCQGFSIIGRSKIRSLVEQEIWDLKITNEHRFIDDPRNVLYKNFVRFIDYYKPKFFLMENVPGLFSFQKGNLKNQIIEDFRGLGYHVRVKKLNAAEFGVPQNRIRVFFLGSRNDGKIVFAHFPTPTHGMQKKEKSQNEKMRLKPLKTLEDAISDLAFIEAGEGGDTLSYKECFPPKSEYQKWARSGSKFLFNHHARALSERDRPIFEFLKPGQIYRDLPAELKRYGDGKSFSDKMKKLRLDEPCRTVCAHLYKDGYMYIHPINLRTITVREAARIQSFPDTFRFIGSRTQQFKQVGNSVPPLLARAIARVIRIAINESETTR